MLLFGGVTYIFDGHADFEVGQPIATMAGGCFSDYVVLPVKFVMPVATMQKEVVALLTSGLTASIGKPHTFCIPCPQMTTATLLHLMLCLH